MKRFTLARTWSLLLLVACSKQSEGPIEEQGLGGENSRSLDSKRCIADSECSDGLFCNGAELCLPDEKSANDFGCLPARVEPTCKDSLDCTIDSCSNSLGTCQFLAPDEDQDGHLDADCEDKSGNPLGHDCDDKDAKRHPGNVEVCDGEDHDEDCDPTTFGERDRDGDSEFDAQCCNESGKKTYCGSDCNDENINQRSKQPEFCDDVDNDCNGKVDDHAGPVSWYPDDDDDLFGHVVRKPAESCTPIPGSSVLATDCQDGDPSRHPAQLEICDDLDNDCDGLIDEPSFCDKNGGFENDGSGGKAAGEASGGSTAEGSGGKASEGSGGDEAGTGGAGSGGDSGSAGNGNVPGCIDSLFGRYVLRDNGTAAYITGGTTFPIRDGDAADIIQGFTALDDGEGWGCGVVDNETESGTVWCWLTSTGSGNVNGQLGLGHTKSVSPGQYRASSEGPVQLPDDSPLSDIVGLGRYSSPQSRNSTCAFDINGEVYCWGTVTYSINTGTYLDSGYALKVDVDDQGDPFDGVVQLALGLGHVCALRDMGGENEVWCWGLNDAGQAGQGTTVSTIPKPSFAAGTRGATAVAASYTSACALVDGQVRCWGSNGGGECGIGTTTNPVVNWSPVVTGLASASPPELSDVVQLHSGHGGYCAITATGELYCWGYALQALSSVSYALAIDVSLPVTAVGYSNSSNSYQFVTNDGALMDRFATVTSPCQP